MKRNKLLLLAAGLGLLFGCEKEIKTPVLETSTIKAPVIKAPANNSTFTFTAADAKKEVLFAYSNAEFNVNVSKDYIVQACVSGNSFAKLVDIGASQNDTIKITYADINQKLLTLLGDNPSFTAQKFDFRISTRLSDFTTQYPSKPITLTITPYDNREVAFALWVPGNFQAAGNYGSDWTPAQAPKIYSPDNNNSYQGYIYFKGSGVEFKFTGQPDWDPLNWGNGKVKAFSGTLIKGGDNIIIGDVDGYYQVNANTSALTYSLIQTTWAIVGDGTATGWPADGNQPSIDGQAMTYSPTTKVWTWSGALKVGAIKFRANKAWDISYGMLKDKPGFIGGENIPIATAGNYTVTLDLSKQPYRYKVTAN